jgi:hypothetical protein
MNEALATAVRVQAYDVAMERYLSVRPRAISKGRPYPKRDELHDRANLR